MCTWHQNSLDCSSIINFVVLETQGKKGVELSIDHHLVVSWLRWWGIMPVRPGRPKHIVRVLGKSPVRGTLTYEKASTIVQREVGDIESEWTMFHAC